jgi:hypothetical protein
MSGADRDIHVYMLMNTRKWSRQADIVHDNFPTNGSPLFTGAYSSYDEQVHHREGSREVCRVHAGPGFDVHEMDS